MSADPLQSLFVFGCSHPTPSKYANASPLHPSRPTLSEKTFAKFGLGGMPHTRHLQPHRDLRARPIPESPTRPRTTFLQSARHPNQRLPTTRLPAPKPRYSRAPLRSLRGLDSQIVGEPEILGQVKDAYARAKTAQSVGPVLNRLFEKSFQAAKAARSQTGINRGHVGIGNITADLSNRIFGHLDQSRVLSSAPAKCAATGTCQSRGRRYFRQQPNPQNSKTRPSTRRCRDRFRRLPRPAPPL